MEELKNDIEQVKVQLLTGIKLGRVDEEWGKMIIETCNTALTIPVVSKSVVCGNCDGYGYTVDENGRRKEHCNECE